MFVICGVFYFGCKNGNKIVVFVVYFNYLLKGFIGKYRDVVVGDDDFIVKFV